MHLKPAARRWFDGLLNYWNPKDGLPSGRYALSKKQHVVATFKDIFFGG